jgi:quinol monooxygenase YgiN
MPIAKRLMLTLTLVLFALALPKPAAAQTEAPLYVVTYIDVFPDFAANTAKALEDFAAASGKDPGFVRFEVMRDVDRINHFAVVEVWRTRKEYEAHLGQAHTKQFRESIQKGLGSPFDERLYHKLP